MMKKIMIGLTAEEEEEEEEKKQDENYDWPCC